MEGEAPAPETYLPYDVAICSRHNAAAAMWRPAIELPLLEMVLHEVQHNPVLQRAVTRTGAGQPIWSAWFFREWSPLCCILGDQRFAFIVVQARMSLAGDVTT